MKYIYSILGIVLLLTCVMLAVSSNDSEETPDKNALVVNDRSISFAELQQRWQEKPYYYRDEKEFLDDLVLREVLVQQAISDGIADEEQFKRLVRDFFEQSLVKTLLDRKQREVQVDISDADLSRFRKARQSRYQLSLIRYETLQQAKSGKGGTIQTMTKDYAFFPESIQLRLLALPVEQLSVPFADGAEFVRLRIEKIDQLEQSEAIAETDESLRGKLKYMLQQKKVGEWVDATRQQAVVRFPQQSLR
ncbi:MAG: hypothetical protein JXK94_15790 [Deltaproteobacteria bacterium]|nr:hypothetical protein [Deltaproteobacteria bacterium]